MPELPEAETIARTLAPHVEYQRIRGVRLLAKRASPDSLKQIEGRSICRVRRYGKAVVLELDRGALLVRLGMTGRLLWDSVPGEHTRALLDLDGGIVLFDDVRQFGRLEWSEAEPRGLGPDPLEIPVEEFDRLLKSRARQVKPLLTDQSFLRGIGNIYADEILFRAGIHPRRLSSEIGGRSRRAHEAMVEVLRQAIECGGSTISDFTDADGRKGTFQLHHRVYARTGQPCPHCGAAIERIVVAQRGTHYCPRCQKS